MSRVSISLCVDVFGTLEWFVKERQDIVTRSEAIRHILYVRGSFTGVKLHPGAGDTVPPGTTVELEEEKYAAGPWGTDGVESRDGVPKEEIDLEIPDRIVDGICDYVEGKELGPSDVVEAHVREYFERPWPDGTEALAGQRPTVSDDV